MANSGATDLFQLSPEPSDDESDKVNIPFSSNSPTDQAVAAAAGAGAVDQNNAFTSLEHFYQRYPVKLRQLNSLAVGRGMLRAKSANKDKRVQARLDKRQWTCRVSEDARDVSVPIKSTKAYNTDI